MINSSTTVTSSTPTNGTRSASKICLVCNDRAIGYNFNVISCESCKAFFRRNALHPDAVITCPYNKKCVITKSSRRQCQQCRLKKCFQVGMTTASILTDTALTYKRSQYRRRKRLAEDEASSSTAPRCNTGSTKNSVHTCPSCTCGQTLSIGTTPDSESIDRAKLDKYYAVMSQNSTQPRQSIIQTTACQLNDSTHTIYLNELLVAADLIVNDKGPIANGEPIDVFRDPMAGILAGMDKVMRMFITCFRQTTAFNRLSRHDQSVLLKQGCYEMIVTRCMWIFDFDNKLWMPIKNLQWFVFRADTLGRVSQGLMERNLKVVQSMNPVWLEDQTLMLILVACTLYNEQRTGLINVPAVVWASQLYKSLLKTYLFEKTYAHNTRHADYAYNALIGKMD